MEQCLNCGKPTSDKFCSACGQKSDTHRITLRRFLTHDIVHGVWHLDTGIVFTLKEAFVRPGQAALDYVAGKRIRYYNIFYLCLLLLGLHILIVHFVGNYLHDQQLNQQGNKVLDFLSQYVRFVVFAIVPLLAINSKLVFRRLKLNFAEHLILAGMCLVGGLVLSMFFYVFNFITIMTMSSISGYIEVGLFFMMILFPIYTYWNACRGLYTFWGKLWRVLSFYLMLVLEVLAITSLIIYRITGGTQMELYL